MDLSYLLKRGRHYSTSGTWFTAFNLTSLLLSLAVGIRYCMLPDAAFTANLLAFTGFIGTLLTLSGGFYSYGKRLDRRQPPTPGASEVSP